MWFNLLVSFVFLFFFRGWGKLAAVISVATIITYLVVPVSVMALRRVAPNMHRPLRVLGLSILAPIAFVLATLMFYWARWPYTGEIMLLLCCPCRSMPTIRRAVAGPTLAPASWRLVVAGISGGDRCAVLGRQQ